MRSALLPIAPLLMAAASPVADDDTPDRAPRAAKTALTVTSTAFQPDAEIPSEYTCDGRQLTPPLAWTTVPARTKRVAIAVEDLDAPATQWIAASLPPAQTSIAAAAKPGYRAPCPPSGRHRYQFTVYAFDAAGQSLGEGALIGTYERARR
jgi:phosphatidylethanolamine-binding protein (PEBP) family uncharacterized protein